MLEVAAVPVFLIGKKGFTQKIIEGFRYFNFVLRGNKYDLATAVANAKWGAKINPFLMWAFLVFTCHHGQLGIVPGFLSRMNI